MNGKPGNVHRWIRTLRRVLAFGALATLMTACDTNLPMSVFGPKSDSARAIDGLFTNIIILAAIVFVVVQLVLFYSVFRFRQRSASDPLPKQSHGNTTLEIAWTIAPAVVLAFVAVPTVRMIFQTYHPVKDTDTVVVRAVGHQWWFEFEYQLPDDPEGKHIVTANELHMPVGKRVVVDMTSADVLHAFWFPAMHGKRDMIPGRVNQLSWTADQVGVYHGQCTQLCGTSHANMRMRAIVQSQADFDAWVKTMRGSNGVPASNPDPEVQKGYQLTTVSCIACHAIQGTSMQGKVGPNLTNFGSRLTLGAGLYENNDANLVRWLLNPQEAKPGNKMPNLNLSQEDARAIAKYLRTLK